MNSFSSYKTNSTDQDLAPYIPNRSSKKNTALLEIEKLEEILDDMKKTSNMIQQRQKDNEMKIKNKLKEIETFETRMAMQYENEIENILANHWADFGNNHQDHAHKIKTIEQIYQDELNNSTHVTSYISNIEHIIKENDRKTSEFIIKLDNTNSTRADLPKPEQLRAETISELENSKNNLNILIFNMEEKLNLELKNLQESEGTMIEELGVMVESRISNLESFIEE